MGRGGEAMDGRTDGQICGGDEDNCLERLIDVRSSGSAVAHYL